MAIQCKITTIQGVTLDKAYVNLSTPSIVKVKTEEGNVYKLDANANVYASQGYYNGTQFPVPVEGISVTCDFDLTKNPLEQLYIALQSNEKLSNITEV